jgi:hypothetical protein
MHKINSPAHERGGIGIADRSLDTIKVHKVHKNGGSKDIAVVLQRDAVIVSRQELL